MKCSFCNKDITPGTGKKYIKKDGKTLNFCSRKCEKNMLKLKKKPSKLKWTQQKKK